VTLPSGFNGIKVFIRGGPISQLSYETTLK